MKKLTCIILCVAMLLSFTACGKAKYYTDGYIETQGSYTGHKVTVDKDTVEHTMRYQLGSYANANYSKKLDWVKVEVATPTPAPTATPDPAATATPTPAPTATPTPAPTTSATPTPTYTEEQLTVTMDDIIIMNFTGYVDGKTFDGGSATDYTYVMGSYTFIDGFDTGMNGKKLGEKFELNLKFPADYKSADLAGKDVKFEVTITSRASVPTTDANVKAYLKDYLGVETVEKLREYVEEQMYLTAVMDVIVETYKLSKDGEAFVKEYIDYYKTQIQSVYDQYSKYENLGIDSFDAACEFYTYYYVTGVAYNWEAFQEYVYNNWKLNFILFDIADQKGMVVTDDEIKQYAKDQIKANGQSLESSYGITSWKGYLNYFGTAYVQFIATLEKGTDSIYQMIIDSNSYDVVTESETK